MDERMIMEGWNGRMKWMQGWDGRMEYSSVCTLGNTVPVRVCVGRGEILVSPSLNGPYAYAVPVRCASVIRSSTSFNKVPKKLIPPLPSLYSYRTIPPVRCGTRGTGRYCNVQLY